ncbi:MAG: Stp1/IreP family PP2C-type Ser/Thr phosphatase [Lachnospiraceae bacterium]|nr:Stp1/IreP family PP2C-type Ser/Thr phosphatase [Lachnospiraceae bacterium]
MKAIALTDKGLVRANNEDTVYCSVDKVGNIPSLFVVADGMGGAKAGEYASEYTIRELVSQIKNDRHRKDLPSIVRRGIEAANAMLYKNSRSDPELAGCGTTLVCAMIADGCLTVFNVGDSRLYIISDHIKQITQDHSYVEEMVKKGRMVRGSQDYLSKKNLITRAIGTQKSVEIDSFSIELNGDEKILLCTDGLSNMMNDEDIFNIIQNSDSIEDAAKTLISTANEHGGVDNVSVVLVSGLKE